MKFGTSVENMFTHILAISDNVQNVCIYTGYFRRNDKLRRVENEKFYNFC